MNYNLNNPGCGSADHFSRRTVLRAAGLSGLSWLTPLADGLATEADAAKDSFVPAKSIIILWMAGGPSQVDTFDPHPGKKIAADTRAIESAVKGVFLNENLPQTAELMNDISLVRSVVSREGDHERASYNIKTGYRPDPTVIHPSVGSIICHEMPEANIDIPTHISIMPGPFLSRGGYLGAHYDPFKMGDPTGHVPDVKSSVNNERQQRRMDSLSVVEGAFSKGRPTDLDSRRTMHQSSIAKARRMMTSEQLSAFDVAGIPKAEREAFGDSRFGRGCLAATRLVEAGVRCVEVTLNGWDTHLNNTEASAKQNAILDPAFAALIKTLKAKGLLESTLVLCGGEFGRTPIMNGVEGRDHWPHGFSMALAGGGIKGGRVIGETDPEGLSKDPDGKVFVNDIHATIQDAFGIEYDKKVMTPVNRPIALSDGFPIEELLI